MKNKFVVIVNSLKVPKIKKILLYEIKFLEPNYSCLQNSWLEGYCTQIPVLSVLNWICWTPLPCYYVGRDFGIFFGLRMATETHSLEVLCTVGRSTAAYCVNVLFVMLWEMQVQWKYKGESLYNPELCT